MKRTRVHILAAVSLVCLLCGAEASAQPLVEDADGTECPQGEISHPGEVRCVTIEYAFRTHRRAQRVRQKALEEGSEELTAKAHRLYREAGSTYEAFLARYPDHERALKVRLYRAECHYYVDEFLESYTYYAQVRDAPEASDDLRATAAHSGVKALEFHLKTRARESGQTLRQYLRDLDESATGQELPDAARKYIQALDAGANITRLPGQDPILAAKYLFHAGKTLDAFDRTDEALRRFERVVELEPGGQLGALARESMLTILLLDMTSEERVRRAEILLERDGFGDAKLRRKLQDMRLRGLAHLADRAFEAGDYKDATEHYLRLADDAPSHRLAPRALNNAAVAYGKMGKPVPARILYERIVEEYPDNRVAAHALYELGILYRSGEGAPEDAERAQSLLERACDAGSVRACAEVDE